MSWCRSRSKTRSASCRPVRAPAACHHGDDDDQRPLGLASAAPRRCKTSTPATPESDTVLAWNAPAGTNYSGQVWSPELHRLGGKWYIYVAASDGNNATHRMHVLEGIAADPFGPFTYVGQIAAPTNRWAIDGTVLEWQGTNYFVWSGWPGFSDGRQNLYIAEMLNSIDPAAAIACMISTPQYSWEMHGLPINEGPQILIKDGKLHIIYSASGFWTPQYALGRLTYNGIGSPLDPASWSKAAQPVFQATASVAGVGHALFTTSPDGTENWIVYHAHRNPPRPPARASRCPHSAVHFLRQWHAEFRPAVAAQPNNRGSLDRPRSRAAVCRGRLQRRRSRRPNRSYPLAGHLWPDRLSRHGRRRKRQRRSRRRRLHHLRKNQGSGAAAASSATAIAAEPATTTRQSTTNESDTALAEFAPSPSVFARLRQRPAPRPIHRGAASTSAANLRQDDLLLTQLAIAKLEVPIEQYRGTTLRRSPTTTTTASP